MTIIYKGWLVSNVNLWSKEDGKKEKYFKEICYKKDRISSYHTSLSKFKISHQGMSLKWSKKR